MSFGMGQKTKDLVAIDLDTWAGHEIRDLFGANLGHWGVIIRDEFWASALLTGRVMGICLSVVQDNLLQNYSWSVLKIPEPNQKNNGIRLPRIRFQGFAL